ncbi:ABC transporter permease [Streptomyces winkii]|uniref:ABC transporter permease n=1 Tax=Streptomyces winkii TaxID=3051178 RepID=UPI0028D43D4D|nr:ABC transporter permease [Streptomyces sp. DSM 40971]
MTAGIARASLRSRPAAFAGTFVALLFASTVVSASTMLLSSATNDDLVAIAVVMLIISIYLAIFVVASTMSTAVVQQQREFAMLRAVGARPWQIRRAVALQAVTAALPAAVLGFGLGGALGWWGFRGMIDNGVVPPSSTFSFTWAALPAALGVAVLTSAVAGIIASVRMAALRPARAVAESASPRRELGLVRTAFGVLAVAGGIAALRATAEQTPDQATQSAMLVLILFCAGIGLLGPRIIGPAAVLASVLLRPFGPAAQAAMLNVRSQTRRYSAAVIPVVLGVAFATMKIAVHTTTEHVRGVAQDPSWAWLDYAGTGLYAGFAAIAAANLLAVISHERRRELALLRVVSATPGDIRRMAAWEAVLLGLTSLILGGVVAALTTIPILSNTLHTSVPYLPITAVAGIVGATLALTLVSIGLPVNMALRRRPTETIKMA